MLDYPITLDISVIERLTDEQFFALCQANRDLRMERNADGTITIMSPVGFHSSELNLEISTEVKLWARERRNGVVTDSSAGFTLPDNSVLSPDVAWISNDRLEGISDSDKERFIPACPNFVVELASPSDSLAGLRRKMETWIRNGVELGWLIDPKGQTVEIFTANAASITLHGFDQSISAEPVLEGFSLDLSLLQR